ncbi:MAG: MFS transporter [Flammeovirgaceae bacterium]
MNSTQIQRRNKRALLLIYIANTVSGFAQGISMLAIPWHFARQNLTAEFNIYYAVITFLTLAWSPNAGAIVDRFNRKGVFLSTNLIEGLVVSVVAILGAYSGSLPTFLIVLVFFITVLGYHIHYPNLYAFAQEITPPGRYTSVASSLEVVGQATSIGSGVIGAILLEGATYRIPWAFSSTGTLEIVIPQWEIWDIFAMDGLTYGVSIILIILIQYTPIKTRKVERGSLIKRLKTGFRYLQQHPHILVFGLCAYAAFVNILVMLHALLPSYVKHHLQSDGTLLGLHELVAATGALMAGGFAKRLFNRFNKTSVVIFFLCTTSFAYLSLSFTTSSTIFLIMGFIIGFANSGARVYRVSYVMGKVPNEVIGRTNSVLTIGNTIMRGLFISLFTLPFFATKQVSHAYVVLGLFTFVAALILLINYKRF